MPRLETITEALLAKGRGLEPKIPYPADTTPILRSLEKQFLDGGGVPIRVSFRNLVPWIKVGERATHYIHSYPAKLLPQIAHFFLAAYGWCGKDEKVLDPFSGTGTVVLEALLSGRSALYADVNPLARLITEAKSTRIHVDLASDCLAKVVSAYQNSHPRQSDFANVINIDYWYSEKVKSELSRLKVAIESVVHTDLAPFIWSTFSSVARKCSVANPRFSVPVRLRNLSEHKYIEKDVIEVFCEQYIANIKRHINFAEMLQQNAEISCVGVDARELQELNQDGIFERKLADESVGLIITSPPYAGAQKYIRASSLNIGWLGTVDAAGLRMLDSASIGRENFRKLKLLEIPAVGLDDADMQIKRIADKNKVRAAICANYLVEMRDAINEMARVLKVGGKMVLVIGDNTVCGEVFPSSRYLSHYLVAAGLTKKMILIDEIKSRGLTTKRLGGVSEIKTETIMIFEK